MAHEPNRVDLHVHLHLPPGLLAEFRRYNHRLGAIERHMEKLMSVATDIQDQVTELEADAQADATVVAGVATVVDGAVTLIANLTQSVADLRAEVAAGLGGAEVLARLVAINTQGDASRDALAAAKDALGAAVATVPTP